MVTLSIKTDFKDVQSSLNRLHRDLQGKVVSAALNKVAAKAKSEMTKEIASEFNIKQSEISARMRVIRAKRDLQHWTAILDPFASQRRGRSLNLIRFVEKSVSLAEGRRRGKAGTQNQLRFQVKKMGGKKSIKGAFIANRGRTVFMRTGASRLPIQALSTIDIPQMFNTRRINARVVQRIQKDLPIEFERAIRALLAGHIR